MTKEQIRIIINKIDRQKHKVRFDGLGQLDEKASIDEMELPLLSFILLKKQNITTTDSLIKLFENADNAFRLRGFPSDSSKELLCTLFEYLSWIKDIDENSIKQCFY